MRQWIPLAAFVSAAVAASAQEPAQFPSSVDEVVVDVVVLGGDGHPVADLKQADFEVKEDGKAQPLTSFKLVEAPSAATALVAPHISENRNSGPARAEQMIVLVLDEQNLTAADAEQARAGVSRFIEGLPVGDRVFLVTTGSGTTWAARMPEGRADLLAVMQKVKGLRPSGTGPSAITDYEAMRIVNRDERVSAEVQRRFVETGVIADVIVQPSRDSATKDMREMTAELSGQGYAMLKQMAAETWAKAQARRHATLRALALTLDTLSSRPGRKTVLMVSAGFVHDPTDPDFARVVDKARRANAVIYFVDGRVGKDSSSHVEVGRAIDSRDVGSVLNRTSTEASGAESVAIDTGGGRLGTAATVPDMLGRLADEGRAYYLIGYSPTNPARDGKFRKIDVKVMRPATKVLARRGYYALKAEAAAPPALAAAPTLSPELRNALESPFGGGDVPLRLTAYVLGPASDGRSNVQLVGEADPRAFDRKPAAGQETATVDTYLVVRPLGGGVAQTQETPVELSLTAEAWTRLETTWLALPRDQELAPGAYEAHLAVRDRASGHIGSVVHPFVVPDTGSFRIATPVLTDSHTPDQAPVMIARRTFAPGSKLSFQFEVQGAALESATGQPRVTVGQELRRPDGSVASHQDPTLLTPGSDGRLSRRLAFAPRVPGPAEFVVTAHDEVADRTIEIHEGFLIDPSAPVPPAPPAAAPVPVPANAAAAAAAVAPPAASVPAVAPGIAGLRQLVGVYRDGKPVPAVMALARWEPSARRDALRGLTREAAGDGTLAAAAALLVTETTFAARPGREKEELEEARRTIDQVSNPARRETLMRLWLVITGQRYAYSTRLEDAEKFLADCLKRDPAQPQANLALASIYELRAALHLVIRSSVNAEGVPSGSESLGGFRAQAGQARNAERAEELLHKALADPAVAGEAHLRRGRVLALLGRDAESARELALAHDATDPRVRALAALFQARQEEGAGRISAAVARAREAHTALPDSQTIAIGLADVLARSGARQEAADVVRASLGGPVQPIDAWWAYQIGALDSTALDALRKEVMQ